MIRFLDSLAGTLAGLLIGVLLMSALVDTVPMEWSAAPRPAQANRPDPARAGEPHPQAVIPAPTVFDGAVGRITTPSAVTSAPIVAPTGKQPAPTGKPETANTLSGIATWFNSPAGVSAAGPDLRAALGPGWRGTSVRVCAGTCVVTVLGDWMRADRLIDLHAPLFAKLAPLSRGVLTVTVEEA